MRVRGGGRRNRGVLLKVSAHAGAARSGRGVGERCGGAAHGGTRGLPTGRPGAPCRRPERPACACAYTAYTRDPRRGTATAGRHHRRTPASMPAAGPAEPPRRPVPSPASADACTPLLSRPPDGSADGKAAHHDACVSSAPSDVLCVLESVCARRSRAEPGPDVCVGIVRVAGLAERPPLVLPRSRVRSAPRARSPAYLPPSPSSSHRAQAQGRRGLCPDTSPTSPGRGPSALTMSPPCRTI